MMSVNRQQHQQNHQQDQRQTLEANAAPLPGAALLKSHAGLQRRPQFHEHSLMLLILGVIRKLRLGLDM
jgi:hypothetical protein